MSNQAKTEQQIEPCTAKVTEFIRALELAGFNRQAIGNVMVAAGANLLATSEMGARDVSRLMYLVASKYAKDADVAEGAGQH